MVARSLIGGPHARAARSSTLLSRAADRRVLVATAVHALVCAGALATLGWAAAPVCGLMMVWGSNTVSHIHLHTPIFVSRSANIGFSMWLTLALGVPQSIWKTRHLRHHARHPDRVPRAEGGLVLAEIAILFAVLALGLAADPAIAGAWVAGVGLGYLLSGLQGQMEHDGGVAEGWSTYGKWHNRLWLNDGYHAEHHRHPGVHWSELPRRRLAGGAVAARGPLVRGLGWLVPAALGALERWVMRSAWLRARVVDAHARAIAKVCAEEDVRPRRVMIVGGGIFPRTALVVERLWPESDIVIVDCDPSSIAEGQAFLARARPSLASRVEWRCARFDGDAAGCDLVSLPLALRALGAAEVEGPPPELRPSRRGPSPELRPSGGSVRWIVHTWVWSLTKARPSAVVAWWLAKRVVLA